MSTILRPDARLRWSDDLSSWYFRLEDCLYTADNALTELKMCGYSEEDAREYLQILPLEYHN